MNVCVLCSLSGDEEDWASALDEFDTAQDAQQAAEAAPSKEEQELAAAKAMVRGMRS